MEAKEKKEALRLLIVNGPPELDWLYSLARRKFIPVTLYADEGEREYDVRIFGIREIESDSVDGVEWRIWGKFNADGQTSWVDSPGWRSRQLWGRFWGVYNKKKRAGWIDTVNHAAMEKLVAQRIKEEQNRKNKEREVIWEIAGEAVGRQLRAITLLESFVYTREGIADIEKEVHSDFAANVEQAGLQLSPIESEESVRLRQFIGFLVRSGLRDLSREYPRKVIMAKD